MEGKWPACLSPSSFTVRVWHSYTPPVKAIRTDTTDEGLFPDNSENDVKMKMITMKEDVMEPLAMSRKQSN